MELTNFIIDEDPGGYFLVLIEGLEVLIENEIEISVFEPPNIGPYLHARVNPHNSSIDIRALHDYKIMDCIINVPMRCCSISNNKTSYLYGTSFELSDFDFCYMVRTYGLSDKYTLD